MPRGQYKKKSIEERFWSKVDKTDYESCWNWKAGTRNKAGYGCFHVNDKLVYAHRFSYELHIGNIPKNMVVMHICDNPKCCNPNHLKIGSIIDNINDCSNKNRQARGSSCGASKLNEDQVKDIKIELSSGIKLEDISLKYGVSKMCISYIKQNKTWAHVGID